MRKSPLAFFSELDEFSAEIVSFRVLHRKSIYLNSPHLIEEVLVHQAKSFSKSNNAKATVPYIDKVLRRANREAYNRQPHVALPAFTCPERAHYAEVMHNLTTSNMDNWFAGPVDIHRYFADLVSKIVTKTLFGIDQNPETVRLGKLINVLLDGKRSFHPLMEMKEKLPLPSTLHFLRVKDEVHHILDNIIDAKLAKSKGSSSTLDFLSALLTATNENGQPAFTRRQTRDQCTVMLTAVHETSANALAWAAYLLAKHPQVFQTLRQEAETVFKGSRFLPERLSGLKFSRAVFAETLRLYPPAWGISRSALVDCQIKGYRIPKGSNVVMFQYLMHRNPKYWENPLEFRPERFLKDDSSRPQFAYFPFGGGSGKHFSDQFACLQGTLILSLLSMKFNVSLVPERLPILDPAATLRPKQGIIIRIARRRTDMG